MLSIAGRYHVLNTSQGQGEAFSNSNVLKKFNVDDEGNLTFDGQYLATSSLEVAYSSVISQQNISSSSIPLPHDCDVSRAVTVSLQGISTTQGVDWKIIENDFPVPDIISWDNLGLQGIIQLDDSVLITYYKKS